MNENRQTNPAADILVVGYGNVLRGDDGVGPRVVERLAAMQIPGVRTLVCQLLTPEIAAPVSEARVAVFVDAAVDGQDTVEFRSLAPHQSSQLMAHAADPRTLLALSRDVFGHAPSAWWLTIPVAKMEFTDALSPEVARRSDEALEKLAAMVQTCAHRDASAPENCPSPQSPSPCPLPG